MTDVFARALRDHHENSMSGHLRYRDGEESTPHDVAGYFESWSADDAWFESLAGRVLDIGAGAGRHALYCQDELGLSVTAIEPTETLVTVLRERGVEDARVAGLFSLRERFGRDEFDGAYCVGTQIGLTRSQAGLRSVLRDLAFVTNPDGRVHFDAYDPGHEQTRSLIGFRSNPAGDGAYRIVQYAYDDELGEPWLFRLFTPSQIRAAVEDTDWSISQLEHGAGDWEHTLQVRLEKD